MAIDQRDVSSTLRFMDDRALQRYAAMHKSDPYIFPLAFQESQNRQKLRMSQQAQMAQQPQPKVADQALAQMMPQQPRPMAQPMPEDQGIATLPAPNMKFGAEGGIMGYEGYDESGVPNTFGEGPVRMMAEGGVARYQFGGSTMGGFTPDFAQSELANQAADLAAVDRRNAPTVAKIAELRQRAEALQYVAPELIPAVNEQIAALTASISPSNAPKQAPLKGTMPEPGYTRGGFEGDPRLATPTSKPFVATPTGNRDAAPRPDTGRTQTAAGPRREAGAEAEKEPTGIEALSKKFTRDTELAQGALRNQRAGLASQLEKEATDEAEATKKRIREEGDVFAKKEARLAAREKGIEGMGDKYMGLALLQAGAAMMSTPGNIGTVLGKGIAVGSERYIAGIDKINAAKDKFAEARDRLDDLRLNRDDMNKKEIRDADRAIRNARLKGQELLVDGATNDLKISNDNQKAIFGVAAESVQTDKKIKSSEKIAGMQESGANARSAAQIRATLSTPDKVMFDQAMAKNGNDAFKAFEAVQQAKGEKFNLRTSYADYIKAFAGKDGLTPPMSIEQYAGKMGALLPR